MSCLARLVCCQTQWPVFEPWDTHNGDLPFMLVILIVICVPCHAYAPTSDTQYMNLIFKTVERIDSNFLAELKRISQKTMLRLSELGRSHRRWGPEGEKQFCTHSIKVQLPFLPHQRQRQPTARLERGQEFAREWEDHSEKFLKWQDDGSAKPCSSSFWKAPRGTGIHVQIKFNWWPR